MELTPIVAAIDFGTTFSGFAFSSKKEFSTKPPVIHVNPPWKTGGMDVQFTKTPTSILFDHDKKFHSFGFEAEKKFALLALKKKHRDWYFFRRFKMILCKSMKLKNEKLTIETTLADETGKEMLAIQVFQASIGYMKRKVTSLLLEQGATAGIEKKIHWVLTVPAIWDEKAKQFMRKAATETGIDDDDLTLALEPEAASLCCTQLHNESVGDLVPILKSGSRYTILDLGGGTADIVSHEIQKDGLLKELHYPMGGDWGGTRVDGAFRQFIIKLIGGPILNKFMDDNLADYLEMMKDFEATKQMVSCEHEEDEVVLKIPMTLVNMFEKETGEELKEVVEQSSTNDELEYVPGKLILSSHLYKTLFQQSTDNIVTKLKSIFRLNSVQKVGTILMVGGFSESKVVQSAVKEAFPDKRFIIPPNPSLAIVRGAVLYGHKPSIIKTRISKLTYGFCFVRDAKPKDLTRDKCYDTSTVFDAFDKLVEIGQEVMVGVPVMRSYTKVRKDQHAMCIMMYTSTSNVAEYVTDTSCSLLGDLVIDLPAKANVEVEVATVFGETELTVRATEQHSKNNVKATFDFLH